MYTLAAPFNASFGEPPSNIILAHFANTLFGLEGLSSNAVE